MSEEGRKDDTTLPSQEIDRPASINDRDDIESAVLWMIQGRVDTKGFAKHLPHTAQDLIDGKVTPEQITNDLEGIYSVRTVRLAGAGVVEEPLFILANLTAMSALPKEIRAFCRPATNFEDLAVSFVHDLHEKLRERMGRELTPENSSLLLKKSLDETCEKWSGRLDKELFRGKRGSFLKKCPLYNVHQNTFLGPDMPMSRFIDNLDQEWSAKEENTAQCRKDSLLRAARNVARGYHDFKRMCWECGIICDEGPMKCSKCSTAGYCSRECQVSLLLKVHHCASD